MSDINEFLLNKLDKLDGKLDDIKHDQSETRIALENHEKRDEEIHSDVKRMGAEIANQSKLLSDYNDSLREHMRRTQLLEEKFDEQVGPMHKEWADNKVIEAASSKKWKKIAAWLAIAATVVGLLVGIAELTGLL